MVLVVILWHFMHWCSGRDVAQSWLVLEAATVTLKLEVIQNHIELQKDRR